ncbi:MAG: serine/threonine-protein kinase [Acidobacteriota bacterium]
MSRSRIDLMARFEALLEVAPEDRDAWLAAECGADENLRRSLEELISADAAAEVIFERGGDGPTSPKGATIADVPAPPSALGRYQVRRRLARGGFGEVFEAWDPDLKRAVAIKTCSAAEASLRRRFAREAEIASGLDHPGIIRVFDVGEEAGVPFLVQELLDGEDLGAILQSAPRGLEIAEVEGLLHQLAEALAYAHRRGVVHRDIKPGNLFRLPDGQLKVLDFGIARQQSTASDLTREGATLGTLAYMAPEQVRGEVVDRRADLFAFGAVGWELLTGRRAFVAESEAGTLYRVLEVALPPLRELRPDGPPALAGWLERCLEKDPAARPESFDELLAGWDRGRPPRRRRGLAIAVAALLGLAAWATLVFWPEAEVVPHGPSGRLEIRAVPWAEVRSLVDGVGRPVEIAGGRSTPLVLSLPPGRYRAVLHHPEAGEGACSVVVPVSGTGRCETAFPALGVAEFLESLR